MIRSKKDQLINTFKDQSFADLDPLRPRTLNCVKRKRKEKVKNYIHNLLL